MSSRPLLLLSCSARKRSEAEELPALERYDGPAFRVLRRFEREFPLFEIEIWVLSAKFGLIPANHPVPFYEQRLDLKQQIHLQDRVQNDAKTLLQSKRTSVFVDAGASYRAWLTGIETWQPAAKLEWAYGAHGLRAAQLKSWLHGMAVEKTPEMVHTVPFRFPEQVEAVIWRGKQIVPDVVPCNLLQGVAMSGNVSLWRVAIESENGIHIVPLKWLVCQMTGLTPHEFSTSQGAAFLRKIGMEKAIFCEFSKKTS